MTQLSQSNVERVALVYISVYFFSCISLIVYFFTFCLSVSIPKNRQHPIKIIYNNKCPS
ncbi:uncharacterized protein YLL006W-A [Saccharomyces cerevisiae S288C]|uniref:Uncharacterized protein YLL006W-A n=1 Tax=Saccharomyces cerevisiae (strain ATCC 204508 / S288c) TaxID=559292 RepID=YL006_YEAST|eukprot:NP_878116.1 hypothetical protein YLL006W-A [Saccharomyces cerevisiae S288C]